MPISPPSPIVSRNLRLPRRRGSWAYAPRLSPSRALNNTPPRSLSRPLLRHRPIKTRAYQDAQTLEQLDAEGEPQPVEYADQPPPPLPEYDQPEAPEPNYLWTPGYWGWATAGYYWVPGAWCAPPYYGALWTPGYWGWYHNRWGFYRGFGDLILASTEASTMASGTPVMATMVDIGTAIPSITTAPSIASTPTASLTFTTGPLSSITTLESLTTAVAAASMCALDQLRSRLSGARALLQ